MNNHVSIPQPNPEYLQLAAQACKLIEKGRNDAAQRESHRIEKIMEEQFLDTFNMARIKGIWACEFFNYLDEHYFEGCFLDHAQFFVRGPNFVVLSQPYDLNETELSRWAQKHGLPCIIANIWSYHYPSRTKLFFVEFDQTIRAEFDRQYREVQAARRRQRRSRRA